MDGFLHQTCSMRKTFAGTPATIQLSGTSRVTTGKISEKLGEIVENADSIPLHRTSVENFGEELNHAKPGELERRRREFHQTPITIDEPAETTTSGAETK